MECIVCAYEIDCVERFPTLSACGHNSLCSLCSVKIRALQRNFHCISCKRELEHMICTGKPDAKFDDFPMWGDSIGPEFVLDQKSQIFFPVEYYKNKIQQLWVYKCVVCPKVCRDAKTLRAHVSGEHNMQVCLHCVENKQDFPAEQKTYTQKQYETHLKEGDGDGSQGHPNCEFCKKRYYDSTALFVHLNKDHYSCHLCEKIGIKFKYFKDYKHLEDHFRSAHILCEDPGCLARKFMVFENDIDMEVHNRKYHPTFTVKRSTTIKLDFKVARNSSNITRGSNGSENNSTKMSGMETEQESEETELSRSNQAVHYEGGLGGRVRNGEWQVELAPISSDPRDANRNDHMTVTSTVSNTTNDAFIEEFPTLQSSGSSGAGGMGPITLTNKWVQLNTAPGRKGKKNDFQSLMSTKAKKTGGSSNSTLGAIQKEYDSMSQDNSGSLGFSSSNSRTQTGSLGDWAHIRVDKRKTSKSNTKSAPVGKADYTQTAYANVNSVGADYEDALAIALAVSMSENQRSSSVSPPPPPVSAPVAVATMSVAPPAPPVTAASTRSYATSFAPASSSSAEAYPSLSASATTAISANTMKTVTQKKKPQKSNASGGWSEALSAMGMSNTSAKAPAKKKLTVIKASTSASSLDRMSQSSPVATPTAGDNLAGVSWDNLKPMGRKGADEEEWRPPVRSSGSAATGAKATTSSSNPYSALSSDTNTTTASSTNNNRTAGTKKYGGWVKMGGAGKEHGGASTTTTAVAEPPRNLRDFPSLGGGGGAK